MGIAAKCIDTCITSLVTQKSTPGYLNSHLSKLLFQVVPVTGVPRHPPVVVNDLSDKFVPHGFAKDYVKDGPVGQSQVDQGEGVQEGEEVLDQLGALPELFLSLACHSVCKE